MNKIILFTDSTCDIPEDLARKIDLHIVPLYVSFDEEIFRDKIEISLQELFDKVKEKGILPKTSAASVNDYVIAFKPFIDNGDKIIYCGIGKELSSNYNNVLQASKELKKEDITVIDSKNLSTSISLALLEINELITQGFQPNQISKKIQKFINELDSKFVIDSLDYLHRGGRCSATTKLVGTLLKIKPIIFVKDGKLEVFTKARGKKKAINILINEFLNNPRSKTVKRVFVTSAFAKKEELDYIYQKLSKKLNSDQEIILSEVGSVIASHCGEKTIGILF